MAATAGAMPFAAPDPAEIRAPSVRRQGRGLQVVVGFFATLVVAGGGWWAWANRPVDKGPQVLTVPTQRTAELKPYLLKLTTGGDSKKFLPEIVDGPEGATLDTETGELSWTPTEEQGPGEYTIKIVVRSASTGKVTVEGVVNIIVEEQKMPPAIEPLQAVEVMPGSVAKVTIRARDTDVPTLPVTFALADKSPPEGLTIDRTTGELTWKPSSQDAGRVVAAVVVRATEEGEGGMSADVTVTFHVAAAESPLDKLVARFRAKGVDVRAGEGTPGADLSGEGSVLQLKDESFDVYHYESDEAAAGDVDLVKDSGKGSDVAKRMMGRVRFYREGTVVVVYAGESESVATALASVLGTPFADEKYVAAPTVADAPTLDPGDALLISLLDERDKRARTAKLFSTYQYPAIRKVFAERFEKEHEADLRRGFGDDYDDMMKWLDARTDFKESLFLAFKPQDDVGAGLALVKELRKTFPKQIDKYLSLVVATAVVWDTERTRSVYDYAHHAQRTHSNMPPESNLMGAIDNFRWLIETEEAMQGRIRYVPWEFLKHVCNHRTPLPERQWSMAGYLPRRVHFGKCYSDVPYDNEMLRTESRICKLSGKDYTLPNILGFGGVCAMQADFAARVGKSIGVPAEYVRGQGASGSHHAWIMWVEISAATPASVGFKLESHGRYRGDNYYVGTLPDPQTGQQITDRDMERRLHSVGTNTFAARQAELVMRAFPAIKSARRMDVNEQLTFLSQTLQLCPWSEEAWTEVARIAKDEELDKKSRQQVVAAMNQLFTTFTPLPDFTLAVFPNLVQHESDAKTRIKHWYRLLDAYASAKRPDLSFDGLLLLADLLVEQDRKLEAIQGLAAAIKKYADQGHYVPRMLDRLESLCDTPENKAALLTFWTEFLPLIPRKRGNESSDYCMAMYQRGIAKFQETGNTQLAQLYAGELQKLRAK
jgi:tetratricopeptide (TPR) repeat protein